MKIKEILLELNVANVDYVERFIDDFLNSMPELHNAQNQPIIMSWFKKQVRNYILNNEDFANWHTPRKQLDPEWMHKAYERGEQIVVIRVSRQFENQLGHVYDWLRWITEQDNIEAKRILQKLPRLTIPMAIQKSEQWTEWLNRKASSAEDEEGLEIIMKFKDGFSWVLLKSKQCYDREGKLMKHCVTDYYDSYNQIYSLRDSNNQPHVTMEILWLPESAPIGRPASHVAKENSEIQQIKGKRNTPPLEIHIPYILKLIKEKGLTMYYQRFLSELDSANISEKLKKDIVKLVYSGNLIER